ncbi:MAG: DHHA1 domain-containing protein [Candidatus Aenigmarchaeota archaeon]|nr:DHHA1 domain-containing protein [Candidatus Aenigmarchaeota archaeon]
MSEESRAHSGEHVLFQSLSRVFKGIESVKVVIKPDKKQLFVKYDGKIDWSGILKAEKIANRIIQENRKIKITVGNKEKLRKEYGDKLRGRWDLIEDKTIRIVEVEDFDYVACKGEHVESTGEIDLIIIKNFKNLGKGEYEIEYEVGEKAKEFLIESKKIMMKVTEILGTTPNKIENTAKNLKEEITRLRENLKEASKKAMEKLEYEEIRGVKLYSKIFDGLDRRELMRKAASLRGEKNTVVIFGDSSGLLVMGRSDDLNFNVIPLLEKGCNFLGGKCGGKQEFAFGGGFKSSNLNEAIDLIKKELIKLL